MLWKLTVGLLFACAAAQTQGPAYDQALELVQQGKPEQAIALLENSGLAASANLKSGNLLGIALLNSGKKDEAAAQFRKVLAVDSGFAPALKNLGVANIARGQWEEAKDAFERLLRLSPDDPVAHLYLGEIAFGKAQYRDAVGHYERSRGLHLRQAEFTLHFAKGSMESGNRETALSALRGLPDDAASEDHFQAGVLLSSWGAYAEAATRFRSAQKQSRDPYEAGFNVVLCTLKAGAAAGAVEAGEQLIAAGFRKAELYNLLSRAYERSGNIQRAYDSLRAAVEIDPADETSYVDLMSLAVRRDQLALGLEIGDTAISQLPKSYGVRLQRGAILALMGRTSDAEAGYLEATLLDPENNLGYIALAMVRIQSGKVAEAVEVLSARRLKSPADYLVNLYLGEALSRQGNTAAAIEALHAAQRANPRVAASHALLGKLLSASGDLQGAARELEEALRLEPDSIAPAYQLAMVYRKLGKPALAEKMLTLYEQTKAPGENESVARELFRLLQHP